MLAQTYLGIPPVEGGSQTHISVIIPSLRGNVEELLNRLQVQSRPPDHVEVVEGVRPNGKARNIGVAKALQHGPNRGQHILVFIDDDALPGSKQLIESLIEPLNECQPPGGPVGVTGAARVLPVRSAWFQRRVATEIPRTVNTVPRQFLETNPPLSGYGHSLITTTCCALHYSTYEAAGRFSEELTSGVDTDFFYRVRQLGYRFLLVPQVYVEHPAPKNLGELWRKYYWYGMGYSQEVRRRPQQHMGFRLPTRLHRMAFLAAATAWLIPNIFVLYSFGYPQFSVGFRPLKAISTYAVAWGYAAGWQRGGK